MADKFTFSWYISKWSEYHIEIDLDVEMPEILSTTGGYDIIAISMTDLKLIGNLTGEEIDMASIIA
jgi:hypothetical protein